MYTLKCKKIWKRKKEKDNEKSKSLNNVENNFRCCPYKLLALEKTIKIKAVVCIRIRIDLAVLDSDPYW
jgi:hypothetical protein